PGVHRAHSRGIADMSRSVPARRGVAGTMLLAGMVGLFVIAGCTSTSREPDITGSNYEQIQVPAAADPLAAARTAFTGKKFAHAARYYEMALARQGDNTEALLGIAAAYDRMWRFDLSEPAYR